MVNYIHVGIVWLLDNVISLWIRFLALTSFSILAALIPRLVFLLLSSIILNFLVVLLFLNFGFSTWIYKVIFLNLFLKHSFNILICHWKLFRNFIFSSHVLANNSVMLLFVVCTFISLMVSLLSRCLSSSLIFLRMISLMRLKINLFILIINSIIFNNFSYNFSNIIFIS